MAAKNKLGNFPGRKTYKVWVQIEVIDEKGGHYEDSCILPDSIGSFTSLKKAAARQWEVTKTLGVDPQNSDARPR